MANVSDPEVNMKTQEVWQSVRALLFFFCFFFKELILKEIVRLDMALGHTIWKRFTQISSQCYILTQWYGLMVDIQA